MAETLIPKQEWVQVDQSEKGVVYPWRLLWGPNNTAILIQKIHKHNHRGTVRREILTRGYTKEGQRAKRVYTSDVYSNDKALENALKEKNLPTLGQLQRIRRIVAGTPTKNIFQSK